MTNRKPSLAETAARAARMLNESMIGDPWFISAAPETERGRARIVVCLNEQIGDPGRVFGMIQGIPVYLRCLEPAPAEAS